MRIVRFGFLLLVLICAVPLVALAASTSIAEMAGCEFNENAVQPCVAMGVDLGGVLAAMVLAGWMSTIAIPSIALVGLFWIAVELIAWVWRTRTVGGPEALEDRVKSPET